MPRFTIYRRESAVTLDAAEHLRSAGVRVITTRPGLVLVEGTEAQAAQLRRLLPDWIVTAEVHASPPRPPQKTAG